MYDELYTDLEYEFDPKFSKEDINEVLTTYFNEYYNESDDKDTWFNNMKEMAEDNDLVLLTTELTMYETSGILYTNGLNPAGHSYV